MSQPVASGMNTQIFRETHGESRRPELSCASDDLLWTVVCISMLLSFYSEPYEALLKAFVEKSQKRPLCGVNCLFLGPFPVILGDVFANWVEACKCWQHCCISANATDSVPYV